MPTAIRAVCPKSRAVYDEAESARDDGVRLQRSLVSLVSPGNDIFCFRMEPWAFGTARSWHSTRSLLMIAPQLRPTQIAIEIFHQESEAIFKLVDLQGSAQHNLPRGFTKSIEWARDARDEDRSGLRVFVKPPQEALALDFRDLRTMFVLSYGITTIDPRFTGNNACLPTGLSTSSAEGLESLFYILDPGSAEVLQHWSIPEYAWATRKLLQNLMNSTESWQVDVNFMAAIRKTPTVGLFSLVRAPTAQPETVAFGEP